MTRPADAEIVAMLRELESELKRCYPYAPYAHKPITAVGICKRARAMADQLEGNA